MESWSSPDALHNGLKARGVSRAPAALHRADFSVGAKCLGKSRAPGKVYSGCGKAGQGAGMKDRPQGRYSHASRARRLLLALAPAPALAGEVQPTMTGDVRIHDPSVIEVDGQFAAFGTGGAGADAGGHPDKDLARRGEVDRRRRDWRWRARLGEGCAGLSADQCLGPFGQQARRDSFPLLCAVDLWRQRKRDRADDQ